MANEKRNTKLNKKVVRKRKSPSGKIIRDRKLRSASEMELGAPVRSGRLPKN